VWTEHYQHDLHCASPDRDEHGRPRDKSAHRDPVGASTAAVNNHQRAETAITPTSTPPVIRGDGFAREHSHDFAASPHCVPAIRGVLGQLDALIHSRTMRLDSCENELSK